ncbi:MAG: CotH kinase family protein, partial [Clostridia bacterium]|nr:CotH kinase family protein [Clostridia bacterium]
MGEKLIDNTILLKLLSVPEYKDKFLTKFGDIFQTFTTDFMMSVLTPLIEQITPEMRLHWARWGELNDTFVISEVPTTGDGAYRYWEKRIARLQNTLKKRPNLLWGYAQDAFNLSNEQMEHYFGPRPAMPDDAV